MGRNSNDKTPVDVASLARSYTKQAIKVLSGIMISGEDEGNRARAAVAILDRGYGKPSQTTKLENGESGPLSIEIIDHARDRRK